MSLLAGSVSVNQTTEVRTGSGMAVALYDADLATSALPPLPTLGSTAPPFRAELPATQADIDQMKMFRLLMLNEIARRANAYAAGVVAHVVSAGKARITTGISVGRTPDPNDPNTPILGPAADVLLNLE